MNVDAILQQKGHEVVCVDPRETVNDVAALLSRRAIGAALVQDSSGHVIGIISERDIVRGIASNGAKCLSMSADEVMTKGGITCNPQDTIHEIMSLMTERRIRHMPVAIEHETVGVISVGDIVKYRISEIETEATALRDYIATA